MQGANPCYTNFKLIIIHIKKGKDMSSKNTKWTLLASSDLAGFGPQTRQEKAKHKVKLAKDAMILNEMKVDKFRYNKPKDKK